MDEKNKYICELFEGILGDIIWKLVDHYDNRYESDGYLAFADKLGRFTSKAKREGNVAWVMRGEAITDEDSDSYYDYHIEWEPLYKIIIEKVE